MEKQTQILNLFIMFHRENISQFVKNQHKNSREKFSLLENNVQLILMYLTQQRNKQHRSVLLTKNERERHLFKYNSFTKMAHDRKVKFRKRDRAIGAKATMLLFKRYDKLDKWHERLRPVHQCLNLYHHKYPLITFNVNSVNDISINIQLNDIFLCNSRLIFEFFFEWDERVVVFCLVVRHNLNANKCNIILERWELQINSKHRLIQHHQH